MAGGIVPLGNALVKVSANHALLVELAGGTAAATLFLAGDGSASAPSFSFTSDPDTGLYLGQANRLDVAVAGVAVMDVTSSTVRVSGASGIVLNSAPLQFGTAGAGDTTVARAAATKLNLTNTAASAGVGLDFATDGVLKIRVLAQNAYATVDALAYQTSGAALLLTRTAYGAGTVYSLTNSAAAIDFGTTDPAITLTAAGTYLIFGQVNLAYTGATVATETATIKVRRTNNTAADVSAVVVLDLPVSTVLTNTYGLFQIPPFAYTTTATDDAITLFANVSAGLSAGTIDATAIGTSIVALRIA